MHPNCKQMFSFSFLIIFPVARNSLKMKTVDCSLESNLSASLEHYSSGTLIYPEKLTKYRMLQATENEFEHLITYLFDSITITFRLPKLDKDEDRSSLLLSGDVQAAKT